MSSTKQISAFRIISVLALLVSLTLGAFPRGSIAAQRNRGAARAVSNQQRVKLSSALRKQAQDAKTGHDKIATILQLNGQPSRGLSALLKRNGVRVKAQFRNFGSLAVELPASVVEELAAFEEVAFLSQDAKVHAQGHLSLTTGADAVRQQTHPNGAPYVLNGAGVGIAVLDSGVDREHKAIKDNPRVFVSVAFTGEGLTDDSYGHGTHVASVAAGIMNGGNSSYEGIATSATLLNLSVLNSQGIGSVSNVMSALDWVMTNRTTYNIRVVNMSLGTRAVNSYRDDPLCMSVRRLVDAGLVVVVAAGNEGKDANGNEIYGQIHSPGIEPSAIQISPPKVGGRRPAWDL